RRGRQPLIPEAPPLSPLSTTPRAEEPAWIVGWGEAQSWLGQMHLIPGRAVLLRGKIALENGCALPGAEASGDDDAWRVAVLDRLVHHAGQRCDGALRPIFLHGLRGIGVTTLLLRYVAAKAPPGSIRLLVDCASNNASPLKDAREALKNRLSREVAKGPVTSLFVAVDGLDLHCRTQAVRDGEPNAALLLEPEAHEFVELVRHESRERQVTLVLTSSDPPSLGHGTDLAALPDWAAPTFLKIVGRLGGIGARLEPSVQDADAEVWSKVLALESATRLPADDRAILQLPLFFDAICGVAPHELRAIETRRDVLSQGLPRARTLGGRQHSYYRALEQLRAFISALEQLPLRLGAQPSEELRQCITLIAAEITGEWMYLLPSSASESPAIRARMRGLRDWLAGDSWRYSDTYALSNLVTALAFLGDRDPVGTNKYRHCNLRNVNIYDPVIANAEFHGVDLSGARVQRGKVSNTKFFGVNLQRAEFSGTRFERAKFVGCSFDAHTFGAATGGGDVLFVEPPEGVMTPTWASNGRSTQ
ncbi:MAG TPA: pentapeptide repeat-containing protein, partial [Thermoanaerobaculia bacterium]|nr:pentapeptide repeat-containing protein [Thermoanaerobaculia bacterium]